MVWFDGLLCVQPVVLVSWGRTLELSTVVCPEVCHWLENTTSTRKTPVAAGGSRKYDRLLTWSAEQHRKQRGDGSGAETVPACSDTRS